MSSLSDILDIVRDKSNFIDLHAYLDFAYQSLEYIENNHSQLIEANNREGYYFYKFGSEAPNQITRPFNANVLYSSDQFKKNKTKFYKVLTCIKKQREKSSKINQAGREHIVRMIYTVQQAIGFALDGLPSRETNTARKLNGDYFELLMLILFNYIGVPVRNGVIKVPIIVDGQVSFYVQYQHDFINEESNQEINLIGSVKTTSKDRVDKIFIDKFLYSKLTGTNTPHIAIFLHDVQRKSYKNAPDKFGISPTFLTGKFKGYTLKLNPLDGVYYFDLNDNMLSDPILSEQIKTFDKLICDDIWQYT